MKVSERKTKLTFVTDDLVRFRGRLRPVVVDVYPTTADIRLQGTRTRYPISWAAIYDRACKIAAEIRRSEKRKRLGR